ncbi:PAS domain-containing protein [Candidatus Hamiltonella endosymbiont of Tuberolachnus salignus]|uniref:PAS domain-containing protein n=1 Tax=Candidatus Williamhamiltonella endosymbiont of Tuberolachnus salignus TaxID=3077954 RepID=UPI0030CC0FCB
MSQMHFNPKDISNQIIYHLTPHPHPHHIRDKVSRYLYMNPAMAELLNVPKGVPVEGKRLSEIKTDISEFFEGIHQQEERVIQKETAVSLLITANFGKENHLQPYIFDIHPFFDKTGQLIGTLAEARQCQFFSLLDSLTAKIQLTSFEAKFLSDMQSKYDLNGSFSWLTQKQRTTLENILAKYGRN